MLASLDAVSCTDPFHRNPFHTSPSSSLSLPPRCREIGACPWPLAPEAGPLFLSQEGGVGGGQGTGWRLLKGLLGECLASWPRVKKKERKPSGLPCSAVCPRQSVVPGQSQALPQRQEHKQRRLLRIRKFEDGKFQGLPAPCSSSTRP